MGMRDEKGEREGGRLGDRRVIRGGGCGCRREGGE